MEWYEIAASIIVVLTAVFGVTFWAKFKLLVKEIREAFTVLDNALADDKLTAEEIKGIVKEFVDIVKIFVRK